MNWQFLGVGMVAAWLAVGVAIGSALGPLVHRISDLTAPQVEVLYTTHDRAPAVAQPALITLARRSP